MTVCCHFNHDNVVLSVFDRKKNERIWNNINQTVNHRNYQYQLKRGIKEVYFDDFLQEYLHVVQTVEGAPGLDLDYKPETLPPPTFIEDDVSTVEIKDGVSDLTEYVGSSSSPSGRWLN